MTGKSGAAKDTVDPETAGNDKEIDQMLDNEEWYGILRDRMNELKGRLGKEAITNKPGDKATKQASPNPIPRSSFLFRFSSCQILLHLSSKLTIFSP